MASFDGSVEALRSYLVPIASSAVQSRFANVSALVLQIYDWLLCLNQEVELIWSPRRSAERTLYLLVRYGALSAQIFQAISFIHQPVSPLFCKVLLGLEGLSGPFSALPSRVIMLRRVAALYNSSKSVLYFLYGALLVSFLGEELTVIFTYWYLRYLDGVMGQPVAGVPFYVCLPTESAPYFWIFWFFIILFDAILCVLVFAKGYMSHQGRLDSAFFRLIVRDSILYYLGVFGIEMVTLLLWAQSRGTWPHEMQTGVAFSLAIEPMLCCRLVLNTRSTLQARPEVSEFSTSGSSAFGTELKPYRGGPGRKHRLDSMGLPQITEDESPGDDLLVQTKIEDLEEHPNNTGHSP